MIACFHLFNRAYSWSNYSWQAQKANWDENCETASVKGIYPKREQNFVKEYLVNYTLRQPWETLNALETIMLEAKLSIPMPRA